MSDLPPPLIHQPRGDLPVLLSVPHSGRDYPAWLAAMATAGERSLQALEDPYVDRLAWRAISGGCAAVVARAPRAAVDCNRAEDEWDPAVIHGARRGRSTARARGGLGIVPARTGKHGYLWRRAISLSELEQRLDRAHRPYHAAIASQLSGLHDRFGCALLIDCHSMPPPAPGVAEIVFGDRFGRTCDDWLSREALAIARAEGFGAGINDPFAGGHIIERHGRPAGGTHALQLEIDRALYLDRVLAAPGPGFDRVARLIETLVVELGSALLGGRIATAAE